MQIAVIGNARVSDSRVIQMCQRIGKLLANSGYSLVCGGLAGVMEETSKGFKSIDGLGVTVGILPTYDFTDASLL